MIDRFILQYADQQAVELILNSGKPVHFDGPNSRVQWERKVARAR